MLKPKLLVKRCGGRVRSKQAEYAEMKLCLLNDHVHYQGRASLPAICLADVQVADPTGTRIFDVRIDVKTAYPDQFGPGNQSPQAFPGLRKTVGAAVPVVDSSLHKFKSFLL